MGVKKVLSHIEANIGQPVTAELVAECEKLGKSSGGSAGSGLQRFVNDKDGQPVAIRCFAFKVFIPIDWEGTRLYTTSTKKGLNGWSSGSIHGQRAWNVKNAASKKAIKELTNSLFDNKIDASAATKSRDKIEAKFSKMELLATVPHFSSKELAQAWADTGDTSGVTIPEEYGSILAETAVTV